MRLLIILLILVCSVIHIHSQNIDLDNTFFLLGMLDDYNSRDISNKKKTEIEAISSNDKLSNKLFYEYLQKLNKEKFGSEIIYVDSTVEKATIYKNLKIKNYLNSFYITKEFDWLTDKKSVWNVIDIHKIGSKTQLYSYVAGAYARSGYKDSTGYHFKFPNSYYKSEMIARMIAWETNDMIELKRCLSCIPYITIINITYMPIDAVDIGFAEREKLKRYLNLIENKRQNK